MLKLLYYTKWKNDYTKISSDFVYYNLPPCNGVRNGMSLEFI